MKGALGALVVRRALTTITLLPILTCEPITAAEMTQSAPTSTLLPRTRLKYVTTLF